MSSHIMVLVSGSGSIPGTERIWKCTQCGEVGKPSLIRQPCPAREADRLPLQAVGTEEAER